MSAKIHRIKLSEDERCELEAIRDRGSLKAKTFKKALALLLCDEGHLGPALADEAICQIVALSPSSLIRLRQRCCETGPLGALVAKVRDKPAREIKVTGGIEARITQLACSKAPEGSARWTLRLILLIALVGMAALYFFQVLLQQRPQLLAHWRRWSYAGFYLDEAYTRLALQIWPSGWAPKASTQVEPKSAS